MNRPSSWQLLVALRREHPRFGLVLLLAWALFIIPLFVPLFLPFVEWGTQAAELAMVAGWGDETLRYAQFHRLEWWHGEMPLRLAMAPLARMVGVDLTMRLVLAGCFVAQPLLVVAILRRRGHAPWAALWTFAALHSYPLHMGHLDYLVSLTFLLGAVASWEKRREDGGWRPALCWAGWALGCAVAETQGFLLLAGLFGLFALLAALREASPRAVPRRLGRAAVALLPGALFVLADAARLARVARPFEVLGQQAGELYAFERMAWLPKLLGDLWRAAPALGIAAAGLLLLLLAPLVPGEGEQEQPPAEVSWLPRWLAPWVRRAWPARDRIAVVLLFILFLLGPSEVLGLLRFPMRLPALALLLVPLVVSPSPAWRSRLYVGATTAWVAWLGVFLGAQLLTFGIEVAEFEQIVRAIPRGSKVRCHISKDYSTIGRLKSYRHFCGHVLARRGGVTGFVFRSRGVHLRGPYALPQRQLYRQLSAGVNGFDHVRYGDLYDYFVVRPRRALTAFEQAPLVSTVRLKLATRNWRLYRRVGSMRAAGERKRAPGSGGAR